MSTDIEQRVRSGLADAPTPADLRLDPDAVTRVASRRHRRRRTGHALLAGVASLTVLGVTWAGGWLPGEVRGVLPASPWSGCPISGYFSEERSIGLAAFEHGVIPLPDGGTVVVGLAQGCPGGDTLLMSATPEPADALPDTVPHQGGVGVGPDVSAFTSSLSRLTLPDGRQMIGVIVPGGARDLVRVGVDAIHEPSGDPVRVPGTDMDAFVLEDHRLDGDLAQVWRGDDELVHTTWREGTTSRVWQGNDPGGALTDTWVGQDRQEQQWVMRDGEVKGPFPVSAQPYAVAFPTKDPARVEVVVVLPESVGELRYEDGTELMTLWLASSEGEPTLHAALVTLKDLVPGEPLPDLTWVPDVDGEAQPVEVVEP